MTNFELTMKFMTINAAKPHNQQTTRNIKTLTIPRFRSLTTPITDNRRLKINSQYEENPKHAIKTN